MKIKIALVFGGKSAEHEVSVISALQTLDALCKEKYEIIPIYISKAGQWYSGESLLNLENYKNLDSLLKQCKQLLVSLNANDQKLFKYPSGSPFVLRQKLSDVSIVLPILHGTYGEDGILQGVLELMNIPYGGCNVLASAIGMDKIMMKRVFRSLGLPVVDDISFFSQQWISEPQIVIEQIEEKLLYPVIVKPADLGSSIGVMKANNTETLKVALDNATLFSRKVIIEKAIVELKEINCSVLGDCQEAEVSVCEEPITNKEELLTFDQKYIREEASKGMAGAKRKIPADITPAETEKIQSMAKQAFQALDCNGVARIDFLIDKKTQDIYINEINTIPGSLSFYLWEASGKSFEQLTEAIILLAQKKHREKNNLKFSFESNIFNMRSKGKLAKI